MHSSARTVDTTAVVDDTETSHGAQYGCGLLGQLADKPREL